MLAVLLLACGTQPLPAADDRAWPVVDVSVAVAGEPELVLHLDGAVVHDDGDGHGEGASGSVDGQPPLTVVGKKSSWELGGGVVVFEGEVRAERGPVTLYCDRLELTWNGDEMQAAVATGKVRVVRGRRTARGARAELTVASGRVELTGDPSVADGPNVLVGQRIVLFLDDERLECDDCRLDVDGEAVAPR